MFPGSQGFVAMPTHSSLFCAWLSTLFSFFPTPLKLHSQDRVIGFVGSDGNIIDITIALPASSFVYSIVNIIQFREFLNLIFYACPRFQFLDVETNPAPWCPVPGVCRILCSNVWGLTRNINHQTMASSQYNILFSSETLVSEMHHMSDC